MNDAPENQDVSFEQELEAAFARMFRPEEAVNAEAWVNWLNQAIERLPTNTELYKRSVHRLRDLCGRSGSLPEVYFLAHDVELLDNDPVSHGGFSDVYRGTCSGKPVALKVLRVSVDDRESVKRAFCQEVVVWKRLSHPNILPFWGVSRASPFSLVSPWMSYGSIRSYIKQNPEGDRNPWLVDVTAGLEYMHSLGIVHGDLKGPNILLNSELRACLTDFGLAGVMHHTVGFTTATGLRGSIRWMSPELLGIDGVFSKLTTQSDIWALGVVWWEIMTGLVPYHELSIDVQVITKLIQKKLLPLPPDLDPTLSAAMQDCWQWDPQLRPVANDILERVLRIIQAPTALYDREANRQSIIREMIDQEMRYVADLDLVESLFIRPLEKAAPSLIKQNPDSFIVDIFYNILNLRECNRRLLESLRRRQREENSMIEWVGDILLQAVTEFKTDYPRYIGHLGLAVRRLDEEMENNDHFCTFLERCALKSAARRFDLKHLITRPSEHLQQYIVTLEAIYRETIEGNSDRTFINVSIREIQNLQIKSQRLTFQSSMGKGATGKPQWSNLVTEEEREGINRVEAKRQSILFEIIQSEMEYVRDLETLGVIYIEPLRTADPPILMPLRLNQFVWQLLEHHRRLLNRLYSIQTDEHPQITSITATILDAFFSFRNVYLEYIPNSAIAAYHIEDGKANNTRFKNFHYKALLHAETKGQNMTDMVNRPIQRLLEYRALLDSLLKVTPEGHKDRKTIPQLLDVMFELHEDIRPRLEMVQQKVEAWKCHSSLVFNPGEELDTDLFDEDRALLYSGKLLRQPDLGSVGMRWSEVFVLLLDNYLIVTKLKEEDGNIKYHTIRRPFPLELLALVSFSDPPVQRTDGILRGLRGRSGGVDDGRHEGDDTLVYPWTLHHKGRMGGLYVLYSETAGARSEWKLQLEKAIGQRQIEQESDNVFKRQVLSAETFALSPPHKGTSNEQAIFTGEVSCSVLFSTPHIREVMAIGCEEGVWFGFRHDPSSFKKILQVKHVTQCAVMEDLGLFLVLADGNLTAHRLEALDPSPLHIDHGVVPSHVSNRLSSTKHVEFFRVGTIGDRTLVIYMTKKGTQNVFRILEPVAARISESLPSPASLSSRLRLKGQRLEWFRTYREFHIASQCHDLVFLGSRIALLCTTGFEIMDLEDFKSVAILQRDDVQISKLAGRLNACKPLGMFRSSADEFLLCYEEFGLYVNRKGDPSPSAATVEWQGTAQQAVYHPPYILLFNSQFVEIRHVETGRLAQFIPGQDVRCIWDGRGAGNLNLQALGSEYWENHDESQYDLEARVHVVMSVSNSGLQQDNVPSPSQSTGRVQQVSELVPNFFTISLAPPSNLNDASSG